MNPFSIYIHIPYCLHKCPYCDFNSYAVSVFPEREYAGALLAELDYRASLPEWRGRPVQTVFFGGGTPSLFSPSTIRKIVAAICNTFQVHDQVEITLEANPGTVSPDSLLGFREAGINRLSLGAQSFSPETLKILGRMHTPVQTESAVAAARAAGFTNINLDLIYGVPKQTLHDLKNDLAATLALQPEHISAYGLTIEKGTEFFTAVKKRTLKLPREGVVIEMMEEINRFLPARDLIRYEISNFAKRGKEARHNMAYWNGDNYLGLGAGAHSFVSAATHNNRVALKRWSNYASPKQYIEQAAAKGDASSWHDELSPEAAMFEFFFLGLRKVQGVNLDTFEALFGISAETLYPATITILCDQGLITRSGKSLALTERGLMLADSVIANFATPEALPSEVRSRFSHGDIFASTEKAQAL